MSKTFKIDAGKFGTFFAIVNGVNSFYLTTRAEKYGEIPTEECQKELIYRGLGYQSVSAHGKLKPDNSFDLTTYGPDGNTQIFQSDAQNQYYKNNSVYCNNITGPGKKSFVDIFVKFTNDFINQNKDEVFKAWNERAREEKGAKIVELNEKIRKLKEEMIATEKELLELIY